MMAKIRDRAYLDRRQSMDQAKNSVGNLTTILLLFATIIFLCIWSPSISKHCFLLGKYPFPPSNSTTIKNIRIRDELEEALSAASMANKTVIIAIINKAYVEAMTTTTRTMLDLFLESFWLGGDETRTLLDHLLLVAADQTSYDRCRFHRLHCYRLPGTDGVDFGGEKLYMTDDFIKMMWRRTLFLLDVLKRGYNFIFTDTDVMWLRNPFTRLSTNTTEDLQISTDKFNGDERSEKNLINTGFYYIKSNNKTISLFENWYGMKDNSTGKKEQDVLLELMQNGTFGRLGLNVRFLDTLYFSGFCQRSKDVREVATVHANCCRTIGAKVADLTAVLGDWKRFKHFGAGNQTITTVGNHTTTTTTFKWSKPIACYSSWPKIHNNTLVNTTEIHVNRTQKRKTLRASRTKLSNA